jgi:hypothetical protein
MPPTLPRRLVPLALLACAGVAHADELAPEFGRYLSLYPGLYFHGGYAQDDRDASFDQNGDERASAAPQTPGRTGFPEQSAYATFDWHFPMFESYGLALVSDRLHTARMTLRYVDTHAEGSLATFAADASDDARTEADDLQNSGAGVGDLLLEFGTFLAGSGDWRERTDRSFAVLLLAGVNVPTGIYDRDAPVSAGSNTWYFQGKLGMHWQPWDGAFVETGLAHRDYTNNEEPAFGSLMPHKQGNDLLFDLSYTQRFLRDLYAGTFYTHRQSQPNEYRNPRYAPNAPPHPDANTDTYPRTGVYRDGGTELETQGLSLYYFVTQRMLAALHWTHPRDGRSGQFLLPFDEKSPSGCIPGSANCTVTAGSTVLVDGMGPARAYSTDRLTLTVTYNFGLGDAFTCTGCKQ